MNASKAVAPLSAFLAMIIWASPAMSTVPASSAPADAPGKEEDVVTIEELKKPPDWVRQSVDRTLAQNPRDVRALMTRALLRKDDFQPALALGDIDAALASDAQSDRKLTSFLLLVRSQILSALGRFDESTPGVLRGGRAENAPAAP
jgi:hypothetical protein